RVVQTEALTCHPSHLAVANSNYSSPGPGRTRRDEHAAEVSGRAQPAHYISADSRSKDADVRRLLSGGQTVAAAELVDAPARVDDLLLARVERMASRANLDVHVLGVRRARLDDVAAAAGDGDLAVLGVDF